MKQEYCEFQASLCYVVRLCLKKQTNTKTNDLGRISLAHTTEQYRWFLSLAITTHIDYCKTSIRPTQGGALGSRGTTSR
jgi:hypothetical protein